MTPTENDADERAASARRARRVAIRRHHPDAGGDAASLQAALRSLDRRDAVGIVATRRGRWRHRRRKWERALLSRASAWRTALSKNNGKHGGLR